MIRKLRLKFICITMAIVTVMMCVIFGLIVHFTGESLEAESIQMMRSAASGPFQIGGSNQLRIPYFIVHVTPRGQFVENSSGFDLSDEELVAAIVDVAVNSREEIGELDDYNLRYCRISSLGYPTIIFADISSEQATLRSLTLTCIGIGIAAFLAFLGVCIFLAGWAVRPVERAWKEQRQFVADASHELKTPLTVIMTNAELLQNPECDPEQQAKFSRSILTMSQQMRSLVEGLLDLARVDNGAAKAAFAPVDLSALAADELLPFEPVYFERGLFLESRIQEGLAVSGSAGHLRQALAVLLDNAMKYSSENGTVWVRLIRQGSHALLSVANTGEPLSREDQQNIFKRFYRVDKARTCGGYGLGLAIAEGIVTQHGGKIWVECRDGWNMFHIQLPLSH